MMAFQPYKLHCVTVEHKGYTFATNKHCSQKWQEIVQPEHIKMIQQVKQAPYSREIFQPSTAENSVNNTGKIPF